MFRTSTAIRLVLNVSNSFLIKNENNVSQYVKNNFVQYRTVSSIGTSSTDDFATNEPTPKKKKTVRVPKISLINRDGSIRIVLLEDAEKIAKRNNFHLVHVAGEDNHGREVYKLLDFQEVLSEDETIVKLEDGVQKFKTTKLFNLKPKIEEHDLEIKIANMNKVLKKHHIVKIFVYHPSGGKEAILKRLKSNLSGTVSAEESRKDRTVLTFRPLSNETDVKTNAS